MLQIKPKYIGRKSREAKNNKLGILLQECFTIDDRQTGGIKNESKNGNLPKTRHFPSQQFHLLNSKDNLYQDLRYFLIFGKLIGVVPIRGLFTRNNPNQLSYKKWSLPVAINVAVGFLLGVNTCVSIVYGAHEKLQTAADYAWVPVGFVYYSAGLFNYVYFMRNSGTIIKILQNWQNMKLLCTKPDRNRGLHVNLLMGITMASAIFENTVSYLKEGHRETGVLSESCQKGSILEMYYAQHQERWEEIVPFNPLLAITLFICNTLTLVTMNYVDITIAILARVIYVKFKQLHFEAEATLRNENVTGTGSGTGTETKTDASLSLSLGIQKWRQLALDHTILCEMLQEIAQFVSPLLFVSYSINIYFVTLQLNGGVTSTESSATTYDSLYAKWSFIHLIGRILLVSMMGAKINEWAHKIADLFKACPKEAYAKEIERAELFISTSSIGFHGFHCFVVTTSFPLQIASVVLTLELVLLQMAEIRFN